MPRAVDLGGKLLVLAAQECPGGVFDRAKDHVARKLAVQIGPDQPPLDAKVDDADHRFRETPALPIGGQIAIIRVRPQFHQHETRQRRLSLGIV